MTVFLFFYSYYGTTRTDLQLNTTFTLFDSLNARINTIAQLRERRERCRPDGDRDISRLGFLGRNGVARLKVLSVKKNTRLLNKRRNCTGSAYHQRDLPIALITWTLRKVQYFGKKESTCML